MKRLTREQQRRRTKRILAACTYACLLALLLIWLVGYMVMDATANPDTPAPERPVTVSDADDGRIPGDDIPATQRCYLTPEETQAAFLSALPRMESVKVTHYCTCARCCGKSDGITASGRTAIPGVTVAVDPDVIPLGSVVMVDYGDGVIHRYRADDTGGAISGARLDVCMDTHEAALEAGVRTATVYWMEHP